MTAEELMTPRFEVMAEYPKCEFPRGLILQRIKYATNDVYHCDINAPIGGIDLLELEKYPHLFRKLNWWELRTKEEMPKKVICKAIADDKEVLDIVEWDMSLMVGWINKEKRECTSLLSWAPEYGYFPVD